MERTHNCKLKLRSKYKKQALEKYNPANSLRFMLIKCDFNSTFALHAMHNINFSIENHCNEGPVAQLNSASDFGSEGYRFESCRGHNLKFKTL